MIFFTGFAVGVAAGCAVYRWYYAVKCAKSEVQCNGQEKDREMAKQLERLISYGNDF